MGAQVLFSGSEQTYARKRGVSRRLSKMGLRYGVASHPSRAGQRYNRWEESAALFLIPLFAAFVIAIFSGCLFTFFFTLKTRQARVYEQHRTLAGSTA